MCAVMQRNGKQCRLWSRSKLFVPIFRNFTVAVFGWFYLQCWRMGSPCLSKGKNAELEVYINYELQFLVNCVDRENSDQLWQWELLLFTCSFLRVHHSGDHTKTVIRLCKDLPQLHLFADTLRTLYAYPGCKGIKIDWFSVADFFLNILV